MGYPCLHHLETCTSQHRSRTRGHGGERKNTPDLTDSPLMPPVLLMIEGRTRYYSAEREEGNQVMWEIFKTSLLLINSLRLHFSPQKNKCLWICADHASALKTLFVFFLSPFLSRFCHCLCIMRSRNAV